MRRAKIFILPMLLVSLFVSIGTVVACGGLFCQNVPVAQQAERIIFTVNGDGTLTAYVQINYTGDAPNFSWVVPVPSVPELDVVEMASFDELDQVTAPIFISPALPACAAIPVPAMALDNAVMGNATSEEVTVLASGTAGPYQYDVVDSPDPDALVVWLNANNYRVTEAMEPLIHVYNEEGMIFLAMKLQPESGVQDIQPIKMTYKSDMPMIPIRLTAVAANPNMNILTWIFANEQTVPDNYEHITIADEDIRGDLFSFGGTNYMNLLDERIDGEFGLAMITEYAQPTSQLAQRVTDPLLMQLSQDYRYVTRFLGRMSPEEMTLDPMFALDGQRPDVSNVHDLSNAHPEVFWNCPKEENRLPLEGGAIAGVFGIGFFGWRRRKQHNEKKK